MRYIGLMMVGLLWLAAATAQEPMARVPDPITRRAVPADGVITIRDYGYRDWGPELVRYRVDTGQFPPETTQLVDAEGRALPCQISADGLLSFVARVPRGEAATWRLQPGEPAASTLSVAVDDGVLTVANEFLAIAIPQPGQSEVRPPLLRWRAAGGDWLGHAEFAGDRRPASARYSLLSSGPALVEYEARYSYAPRGEYVFRLRLSPGMPVAVVTEEFDLGEVQPEPPQLLLHLNSQWQPATLVTIPGAAETQMPQVISSDYAAYLEKKAGSKPQPEPVGGVGEAPSPQLPGADWTLLERLVPAGKWGGYMGALHLLGPQADGAAQQAVGVLTLNVGQWRRSTALNCWHDPQSGVVVGMAIGVRPIRWSLDIADDFSPFSTHEHDEELPRSYGRRVWGLSTAVQDLETGQAQYGHIGLDRYKDWLLDLPDQSPAQIAASYPGAHYDRVQLARLKAHLDQHPDAATLKRWYLISGETAHAVAQAEEALKQLRNPYGESGYFIAGLSHYRQAQFRAPLMMAEDALACPELPLELRRELRLRLALFAHLMSEPDFNPRGAGVHLGNNNMTINRTLGLTYFAALLPDHPRFAYWMWQLQTFAQYKFSTQTAPDGVWVACPTYQLYSPTRALNVTQNVLRNRGIHDFGPAGYHAATLRYLADLSMVDSRYDGRRILPGMGNSANMVESIWGLSLAAVEGSDPEAAAFFRAIQDQAMPRTSKGEPTLITANDAPSYLPYFLPDIAPGPLDLPTRIRPTYGVVFRDAAGTPQETGMLLRAGMNWSHWDTDALNVVAYAAGAPLSPGTGYQYLGNQAAMADNGIYHNRLKIGKRDTREVFGRVDGTISDYGFGPSADYAVAEKFYPSQLFESGAPAIWRRHVMFVKNGTAGQSYWVMRDTVSGDSPRPAWWNWLNLGDAAQIAVDGDAFDAAAAPLNKGLAEAEMPSAQGQVLTLKSGGARDSFMWWSRPRQFRIRATFDYAKQDGFGGRETKTIVEVPGAAGEDFLYVLYPLAAEAAAPACETLADGVVRVSTGTSVDTVIMADSPVTYSAGELHFSGSAGAIRVYADRVVLSLQAGKGEVGYGGHIYTGYGPFERTVKLAELQPGKHPVTDSVEKRQQRVELGDGIVVRGEGPFEASLDGEVLRISTDGRARTLFVSTPSWLIRPQYAVDGQDYMACWTDYPDNGWGSYDRTWTVGLTVPAGEHSLTLRDLRYPPIWQRQFTPTIGR